MKKILIVISLSITILIFINLNQNRINEENRIISLSISNNKKLAALTFDDGPSSKTIEIVDLLNKYKIKATFYLLGERVTYFPDEVMYIVRNKHEIGNHSYSHPDFKKISRSEGLREIEKTQNIIYDLTKIYPKTFRFPYGSENSIIKDNINLSVVFWNIDSEDWKYMNDNIIINNVISNLNDESIILFHDNNNYKREALEYIINFMLKNGYKFVTISELYKL